MHAAGKMFVKTYLETIRDIFFPNMWFFYPTEGESLNFYACRETHPRPPLPQFLCLVGHPDLPMKKILRVVGLLNVMIFFQSKTFTACKIKDEKEETIFYLRV